MSSVNAFEFGKLPALAATTLRGILVKDDGSGNLTPTTAITDVALGVLPEKASVAGERMNMVLAGVVKVRGQGVITIFDHVVPSASVNGAVVTASTTGLRVGKALNTSADGDDLFIQLYDYKEIATP